MSLGYRTDQPSPVEIAESTGPIVLEFGANWCGICRATKPLIDRVLESRPDLPRVKAEDAKGRPLGRAFGVKLWPTLVMLNDGVEVARVVRPRAAAEIEEALALLS